MSPLHSMGAPGRPWRALQRLTALWFLGVAGPVTVAAVPVGSRSCRATAVKSTGQATMALRDSPDDGAPEVLASGTLTLNSVYTVDFPQPDGGTLTALRLEVRPDDEAKAVVLPETGFVLSQLRVQRVEAEMGTDAVEIPLATAATRTRTRSSPQSRRSTMMRRAGRPTRAFTAGGPRFSWRRQV